MTYVWLTDLDLALQSAGVPYTEVPASASDATGADSWHTRGRPEGTGDGFFPDGVVCHHTASPEGCSAENDLRVILSGNSDAPGPVSQLYVSRDAELFLVAAGRANHAGSGMRPGRDFVCTDQNARNVGIEVGNNGVGEPWSDAVCDIYAATVAALLDWYDWPTDHVYLHNTTGPPHQGCNSKIDPAGPWTMERHLTRETWDLGTWRAFCDSYRGGAPIEPDEGDDEVTDDDVERIAQRVWSVALHNYASNEEQAATFLLGFAHSEAYDGSWKRQAQNMMTNEVRNLDDLLRFAHYEAATANQKCDRILAALESAGIRVPGD